MSPKSNTVHSLTFLTNRVQIQRKSILKNFHGGVQLKKKVKTTDNNNNIFY